MFKSISFIRILSGGILLILALAHCRSAAYEIIDPSKKRRNPDNFGPKDDEVEKAAPTAALEVVKNGLSVTKVRVNEATTIQPTADTLDPDNISQTDCPNPGIVKAAYKVGSENVPEVVRNSGCTPLSIPYTFKSPGDYFIALVVTSDEGETAYASMTLRVLGPSDPGDQDGGFLIVGRPMVLGVGQNISLSGICTTKKEHEINWTFNDGSTGQGAQVSHAYAKTGSYRIDAICREKSANGQSWAASITVSVMNKPVSPPSPQTPPGYLNPLPPGTPDGNVGQNPSQDQPGQTPQKIPAPPLPWGHSSGPGTVPNQPPPGSGGAGAKKCGFLIFQWSC